MVRTQSRLAVHNSTVCIKVYPVRTCCSMHVVQLPDVSATSCCHTMFRWSDEPSAVHLSHTPHARLTRPVKALEFDFSAPSGSAFATEAGLTLQAEAAGCLNAVVLFFDLHLAEDIMISSGMQAAWSGMWRVGMGVASHWCMAYACIWCVHIHHAWSCIGGSNYLHSPPVHARG